MCEISASGCTGWRGWRRGPEAGTAYGLEVAPFADITVDMLEAKPPRLRPGDMLLLCPGWAAVRRRIAQRAARRAVQ